MNDSNPNIAGAAGHKGSGSKYLFIFLLGLIIGVVATVMALRAIEARRDQFPGSVMQVQQWHFGRLRDSIEQNRCDATDTLPHLQSLRTMANDIEPAFPDLSDDKRFADHASKLRATLNAALSSPPLDCAGVGSTVKELGDACKACHQDFRG